jgi:hypothetical protein
MAEVGHVTPGKPIWPEHHGELPARRSPPRKEHEGNAERGPGAEQEQPEPDADDQGGGQLDEYA